MTKTGLFTVNENKRIVTPDGHELSGTDVLELINKLWTAYVTLHYAWEYVSEAGSIMDTVFLGATRSDATSEYSDDGKRELGGEVREDSEQESEDDGDRRNTDK